MHPSTGQDVAHLLIHPLCDSTSLRIAGGSATVVRDEGDVLSRPVTDEWSTVALSAGWVILTIGQDGLVAGAGDRLEKYLRRAARLYMGRIAAFEPESS